MKKYTTNAALIDNDENQDNINEDFCISSNADSDEFGERFLVADNIKLNERSNYACKNDSEIKLTNIEYRILRLLMQNRNQIFSIRTIYETIWQEPYLSSSNNTVMVHIRKLRTKIEDNPQNPKLLRTEWGRGYKFVK